MKKKSFSAYIMAALLSAGIASTQATAGILAEGNISVYKGGHLSNTITGQNPVDEEALMVCNETCMIKSTGVSIVGTAGAELAVKSDQEQFNVLLKQGQLDFILNGAIGKMGFYTADRQYASADVIFNASTDTPVRGYMEVTPNGDTKIGVYEGRMVFDTVEGAKTVDSNNYILLAQVDMGEPLADDTLPPAEEEDDDDKAGAIWWSNGEIIAATAVAGTAAWGVYEYFDDDDDDAPAPSSPEATTPAASSSQSSSPSQSSSSSKSSSSTPTRTPTFPTNPSPSI
ncbi:MAG: hypothetical protein WGN25_06390 [Candidatus Electrothrix sp. GW3-4]|uniref:hypothetical protein n=1 Tax=Candidatus Electrothrix sp. GW3-4 TaxID=3126740 RepID=UPI0030D5F1B1